MSDSGSSDAIEHLAWAWEAYAAASTPVLQASRLAELANAVHDVVSWHPEFNIETGLIGEPEEV